MHGPLSASLCAGAEDVVEVVQITRGCMAGREEGAARGVVSSSGRAGVHIRHELRAKGRDARVRDSGHVHNVREEEDGSERDDGSYASV